MAEEARAAMAAMRRLVNGMVGVGLGVLFLVMVDGAIVVLDGRMLGVGVDSKTGWIFKIASRENKR